MEFVFENDRRSNFNNTQMDLVETGSSGFGQSGNFGDQSQNSRRSTRRSVANNFSDVEFTEPKRSRARAAGPKVNYVKPIKKKRKAGNIVTNITWTWTKLCWLMCAFLVLRLIFMENGVFDYYKMSHTLTERDHELELIRQENADLLTEIHNIRTSPLFQKKIAREHLGVIAPGEYLILFANERIN